MGSVGDAACAACDGWLLLKLGGGASAEGTAAGGRSEAAPEREKLATGIITFEAVASGPVQQEQLKRRKEKGRLLCLLSRDVTRRTLARGAVVRVDLVHLLSQARHE